MQAMKSVERIPSGITAFPPAAAQQSINPNAVGNGANHPQSMPISTGLALRQESLEALASGELTRSKMGGSQTLFADVLEQVSC
jgi:hypothetical protein